MKYETREKLLTTGKYAGMVIAGLIGGHAATQYVGNAPTVNATQAQLDALTKRIDALQACRSTNLTLKEPLPLKVDVRYLEKK